MSEQIIYDALRAGGLSLAGACALMGNMYCESLLKATNVEDRCTMSDFDYTHNVDAGIISKWQFMTDAYGYGLCQWTFHTRKRALYDYAKGKGVSIGDEAMQCEFCLSELRADYSGLYSYLCSTEDVAGASNRICAEYERPAVNNFADRTNAAFRYYNEFVNYVPELPDDPPADDDPCDGDSCPVVIPGETCSPVIRVLKRGHTGADVIAAQSLMLCRGLNLGASGPYGNGVDGDFGQKTEDAVKAIQRLNDLEPSGVIDLDLWQILFD